MALTMRLLASKMLTFEKDMLVKKMNKIMNKNGLRTLLNRWRTNVEKGISGLKNIPDIKKNTGIWNE